MRKNNRLYKKFMLAFLLCIWLPFAVILAYWFRLTTGLQAENERRQNEALAAQVAGVAERQIEQVEHMCQSVLQNDRLLNFLDKPFDHNLDLNYYTTRIYDFIKTTNGASDVNLRLYLNNTSIPMGFSIFYPMHYLQEEPKLAEFAASSEHSAWLEGLSSQYFEPRHNPLPEGSFCYLEKIYCNKRCIGIITASVPERAFYSQLSVTDSERAPLKRAGYFIYNFTERLLTNDELDALLSKAVEHSPAENHTFSAGSGLLATLRPFPHGPFNLLVVSLRPGLTALNLAVVGFSTLSLFLLTLLYLLYNRRTLRSMDACLDGLERAISDGFTSDAGREQIEREGRRRNEVARLATRIAYLLDEVRSLLSQTVEEQTAARQAQLAALQHQLNPHFLYNTMELFSSRMELAGHFEESDAIAAFCRMLRYNINTKEQTASLGEELEQVRYFLAIQRLRKIPFEFNTDIPTALLAVKTIRFLLEPFVENSFKYRDPGKLLRIHIAAKKLAGKVEICISNTGEGIGKERREALNERFLSTPASVETSGDKVGLNNINSRLKLFYGEDHCIRVEQDGEWTRFSFSFDSTDGPEGPDGPRDPTVAEPLNAIDTVDADADADA